VALRDSERALKAAMLRFSDIIDRRGDEDYDLDGEDGTDTSDGA
jgi:hypothetical protein